MIKPPEMIKPRPAFIAAVLLVVVPLVLLASPRGEAGPKPLSPSAERAYWVSLAARLATPVLRPMAQGRLQQTMLTEFSPSFDQRDRRVVYMETFGRLMAGLAPWLALPDDDSDEGRLRRQLRGWALQAYANAVDPASPDRLLWQGAGQTLVDAAYLAQSFLRAWQALWVPLEQNTKDLYIKEFQSLRDIDPPYTNWLLFSATIESFLARAGAHYDQFRLNQAIRKTEEWYVGDGWYSDGPAFAFDYYSSYVFHPMYLSTLEALLSAGVSTRLDYAAYLARARRRAQKYSVVLERFISPEGTFPVVGRSIVYRLAALQPLALMAWQHTLPDELTPAQTRNALSLATHRLFDNADNFNAAGFLTIGFCGHQPDAADWYTNNGSLYMTSLSLLPLGLPADDPFWTDPDEPTTQQKAWGGRPFPKDHIWRDTIATADKW